MSTYKRHVKDGIVYVEDQARIDALCEITKANVVVEALRAALRAAIDDARAAKQS